MISNLRWHLEYAEADYDLLWENCLFVMDTNILLNFNRYTNSTNKDFLTVLEKISERLWVPHQVLLEYQYNVTNVQNDLKNSYGKISGIVKKLFNPALEETKKEFKQYRNHPFIKVSAFLENAQKLIEDFKQDLEETEKSHESEIIQRKETVENIHKLFKNVGEGFTEQELKAILQSGQERYKILRPPGFEDRLKKDNEWKQYSNLIVPDRFGDFVIWKQILKYAKTNKKPIIFVTDDEKEDWWRVLKGKKMGPRLELIDEFSTEVSLDETNKLPFHMYTGDTFLHYAAKKYLNEELTSSVEEAKDVRLSIDEFTAEQLSLAGLTNDQEEYIGEMIKTAMALNSELGRAAQDQFDVLQNKSDNDISYRLKNYSLDMNVLIDWLEVKINNEQ
ncbi:PIN-like domain-containing protein [Paenibacillus sp. FSL L8-0435]|uniref:PIN-like domain-containing protein n=1 Tax=Paenibacillus TaxID=44249 RepID=UPI001C8D2396|nr:PIN-like domain-containing protein [Paenibacillus xylanexedens]MBY0115924.1 DUF4935 domain-containing protein [Paenibacillus xylanexedens]